jgi:hypothetical protein
VLFDVDAGQVERALKLIGAELRQFEQDGLLKGDISAEQQAELISGSSNLEDCVKVCLSCLFNVCLIN